MIMIIINQHEAASTHSSVYCLAHKMEAVCSSEMPVDIHRATAYPTAVRTLNLNILFSFNMQSRCQVETVNC
jgi:hypothetical protein